MLQVPFISTVGSIKKTQITHPHTEILNLLDLHCITYDSLYHITCETSGRLHHLGKVSSCTVSCLFADSFLHCNSALILPVGLHCTSQEQQLLCTSVITSDYCCLFFIPHFLFLMPILLLAKTAIQLWYTLANYNE